MTMTKNQYLNLLVNEFHSATMATIGADGHPVTRIIDLMLWDESGVYFLTAKGKSLYTQLMEQKFIALSATADKRAISLRGKIKNIHSEKLEEIFERNPYMKGIYPGDTKIGACTADNAKKSAQNKLLKRESGIPQYIHSERSAGTAYAFACSDECPGTKTNR